MRQALLLTLLVLGGCASASEGWPSLARRPGEQGVAAANAAPAAPAEQAQGTPAGPATVAAARLAEVERDLKTVETRWTAQAADTRAAVAAARAAAPSSEAWAKGQLELSRLEKAGAQADELRDRLNVIAGDLAVEAANGADVGGSVAAAGRLIQRVEALRAQHLSAFEEAQRGLQR